MAVFHFNRVKEVNIQYIFKRLVILHSIYFCLLTIYMLLTMQTNLEESETSNPFALLVLLGMVITMICSFYELRLVRSSGQYLFPIARHFLFLGKFVLLVLSIVAMIIFKNYLGLIISIVILAGCYYLAIVLLLKKYDRKETIYIDYTLSKLKIVIKPKNFLIGIAVTMILFAADIIFLGFAVNFYLVATSIKHISLVSTAVVLGVILICVLTFYCASMIKYNKTKRR